MSVESQPRQDEEQQQETRKSVAERPTQGQDKLFAAISKGAGIFILVILFGVAFFLTLESLPAFSAGPDALPNANSFTGYVLPLLFGTVWSAVLALLLATPLGIAIALFMSHYAPKRLAKSLGFITDLLAAVPSVVYGLWGIFVLAPFLVPIYDFLEANLGFLPFFEGPVATTGRTMATAAVVLSVMILPFIAAISREVFDQTPRLSEEAALALGATRWEMIRTAVLPYGRSGVIGGSMLALGRALGETMAVALVLSPIPGLVTFGLIATENPSTIAANIALKFPESSGIEINALFASGLVLFATTFIVNLLARRITRTGAGGA